MVTLQNRFQEQKPKGDSTEDDDSLKHFSGGVVLVIAR